MQQPQIHQIHSIVAANIASDQAGAMLLQLGAMPGRRSRTPSRAAPGLDGESQAPAAAARVEATPGCDQQFDC